MNLEIALRFAIETPRTHAQWLNTLSLMEYVGASQIQKAFFHTEMTPETLRHMTEEFRHAYILKSQALKIGGSLISKYSKRDTFAHTESCHYIPRISIGISRALKEELKVTGSELRKKAYILVTFAVETRAMTLYPVYQSILDELAPQVSLKPLMAEEERHLETMLEEMKRQFGSSWRRWMERALEIESAIYHEWSTRVIAGIFQQKKATEYSRQSLQPNLESR